MIDTQFPFRTGIGLDPGEAREVARLLDAGLFVPVLLDVVVAADAPADQVGRARALRLLVPDGLLHRGAAVAQQAAAWLWCGGPPPAWVDVAVSPGQRRIAPEHLVVHERRMPPDDVTVVQLEGGPALTVTTGARTGADLLRTLPESAALAACVRVAAVTGTTVGDVAACLERMPRARGVAQARRRLNDWPESPVSSSPGAIPGRPGLADPFAGDAIGVEHALHPSDSGDDVVEMRRVSHLEREP